MLQSRVGAQEPPPLPTPSAQTAAPSAPQGQITLQKFVRLRFSLATGAIRAEGGVQVTAESPREQTPVTLTAQDVQYDPETRQVVASGGILLERAGDMVRGRELRYNFETQTGYFLDAQVTAADFRIRGERIEAKEDGTFQVSGGAFTTCEKSRPDYLVKAKSLTLAPNGTVTARGTTLFLGGTRLLTVPHYQHNRGTRSALIPILPGYNVNEGFFARARDSLIETPHEALDYDFRVNLRRLPAGFLAYQRDLSNGPTRTPPARGLQNLLADPLQGYLEQLSPPTYAEYESQRFEDDLPARRTFFGVLQSRLFVYNRQRQDLLVSRLPEVGLLWSNVLGKRHLANGQPSQESLETVRPRLLSSAPFLLDLALTLGYLQELPTNADAGRLGFRARMASPSLELGRRLSVRAAASYFLNLYSSGTAYNILSPEAELDYRPTRASHFGIRYRFAADGGTTPFAFDRQDVHHELSLRLQVGGPWGFGVTTRYDLERLRAFDSEFSVLRNLDCMQVGLAYRARSQSINLIFNLTPSTRRDRD